jgi:hypothetical protein
MKMAFLLLKLLIETVVHVLKQNLKGGVAEAELVTKLSGTGKASPFSFLMVDGFRFPPFPSTIFFVSKKASPRKTLYHP